MTNTIAPNKATLVTNIAIVPSRLNTFYYRNDPGEKRFLEGNEGKKKKKQEEKKRASLTVRGPSYAATTTCDIEFQRSVIRVSGYLVRATYLRCSSRTTLYRELNLVYFISLSLSLSFLFAGVVALAKESKRVRERRVRGCIECPAIVRSRLWCPTTPRSFHG